MANGTAVRRGHAPRRRLDLALQCYMVHALPEQRPQPLRCRTPLASEGAQVMTAPAEPAQPQADEAEISPATQTLEKTPLALAGRPSSRWPVRRLVRPSRSLLLFWSRPARTGRSC